MMRITAVGDTGSQEGHAVSDEGGSSADRRRLEDGSEQALCIFVTVLKLNTN